jgi:hypothetical protein
VALYSEHTRTLNFETFSLATVLPHTPSCAQSARSVLVVCDPLRARLPEVHALRRQEAKVVSASYVMDSISLHHRQEMMEYLVHA